MSLYPATLFPHCRIREEQLERLLSRFSPLTVCVPWFMEPGPLLRESGHLAVRIARPPQELRPPDDFPKLLQEYRGWMAESMDRGNATSWALISSAGGEDATWEIRGRIRDPSSIKNHDALRWHMILHLAAETEKEHEEAQALLRSLREASSPLKEALSEEGEEGGPLRDLAPSHQDSPFQPAQMEQLLEAWTGLFGVVLKESATLLTLSPYVLEFVRDRFENRPGKALSLSQGQGPRLVKEGSTSLRLMLPRVEGGNGKRRDPIVSGLSGKVLILMREGHGG